MRFAAVDVGSNAVRLLLTRVIETASGPFFRKESLVRIPLRLGEDTFTEGRISDRKARLLLECMEGFKHLIAAYEPEDSLACATSAMRDAANGRELADAIQRRTGIDLRIVDGGDEAKIIVSNRIERELEDNGKLYLYIDVGGGSTELTFSSRKEIVASRSFDIGTVRLVCQGVPSKTWEKMREWLRQNTRDRRPWAAIGSGGNVNKLFRMVRSKEGKPVSYKKLLRTYRLLERYTNQERVTLLNLRPDRADVIVPASRIYLSAMKWAGVRKIYVPQIGLADGLVHILYERRNRESAAGKIQSSKSKESKAG